MRLKFDVSSGVLALKCWFWSAGLEALFLRFQSGPVPEVMARRFFRSEYVFQTSKWLA